MAEKSKSYKHSRLQVRIKGTARFPAVHRTDAYDGKAPKFKIGVVADDRDAFAGLEEAALKIAAEVWPKIKAEKINVLIKDGDNETKQGEPIEELAGKFLVNATCGEGHPPKIVGPDKQPLTGSTEVRFGDEVAVIVSPLACDLPVKNTITFRLLAVQLIAKRGGGGNYADLFDEEGEGLGSVTPDSEPSSGMDAGSPDDTELPF